MKSNRVKYYILSILLVICSIMLGFALSIMFNGTSIKNIEKTSTSGLIDTYTITYTNGKTSTFNITNGLNGEDGQNASLTDAYNSLKSNGYNKSYEAFLKEFLSYTESKDTSTLSISNAILSSVSVYSQYQINTERLVYVYNPETFSYEYKKIVEKSTSMSAGSGIIYSLNKENGNAYIITNYHVVYNNDAVNKIGNIKVFLYGSFLKVYYEKDLEGNKIYDENGYPKVYYSDNAIECEYVGGSLNYDIAVLKVTNSDILKNSDTKAVEISDNYVVGDTAIAIGNPESSGISVTQGIVSVESEYIKMLGVDEKTVVELRTMRIDTPINSGNSGGGLFNNQGELIGIVNAKISASDIENIAYAIPKQIVINVANNIIYNYELNNTNKVNKISVGLWLEIIKSSAVYDNETKTTKIIEQVKISEIIENTLASTLTFEVGDILKSITINTTKYNVDRMFNAIDTAINIKVGDSVVYEVERNGELNYVSFIASVDYFEEVI